MATPLSAAAFLAALKAEGCKAVEYRSWRSHNRNHVGSWGPVNGVMIHHTVSSGEDNSVALCYNGHANLPGPLCHTVGGKSGKLYMVSAGRANHAGSGDDDVLRAVTNETALPADNEANTDGNSRFYGLEIVNLGNGKDQYPAVQYDAAVRWAAALCRAHGWGAGSVIGHKEWQPGKIDPYGPVEGRGSFDMTAFRRDVAERLKHPASWSAGSSNTTKPPAQQEEDPMAGFSKKDIYNAVWETDAVAAPADAPDIKTNKTWQPQSYLRSIYNSVVGLPKVLDALRKDVAALRADVANLKKES
ncbi:N-acetylmuramoyl-L-alanine amidase (plasmid) [Streptomyces sp. NBC_01723]|uniref:N-acetylmuramoyl-L-alanine amidase n=1 Tax=Streptomyces sp. NBC_01723 TaxID=2975921 RepID=UPI002E34B3BF|nr:N-acetylmuramoyl-L-alanine amidase [Streptomyces sp. NBC_01723]